jgi:hypothetical protein
LAWELDQTVLHGKLESIKTFTEVLATYRYFARERAFIHDCEAIVEFMMMNNEIVILRASWNCKCVVIVFNFDVLILTEISNRLSRRGG